MTKAGKITLAVVGIGAVGVTAYLLMRKKSVPAQAPVQQAVAAEEVVAAQPAKKDKTLRNVAIGAGVLALGLGLGEILSKKKKTASAYSPAATLGKTPAKTSTLLDAYGK